ncbi:unnamed protein product [Victoria cruziana]
MRETLCASLLSSSFLVLFLYFAAILFHHLHLLSYFIFIPLESSEWRAHWTTRRGHLRCYTSLEWMAHYRRCKQHIKGLEAA